MRLLLALTVVMSMVGCMTVNRSGGPQRDVRDENQVSFKNDSAPRKRLMILPFLDSSEKRPQSVRDRARTAFIADLNRSGELIALDSRELNLDLTKMMDPAGGYKLAEVAKAANALGVNAVLEGRVLDVRVKRSADNVGVVRQLTTGFEVVAQVRVVTARGGQEIFNTIKTVTLKDQGVRVGERVESDKFLQNNPDMIEVIVKDAFLDFSPQVLTALEKISWEGRIAAIQGDRIYLNVGKISGLEMGDLLKVIEEGDDIYDPESGTHIGRAPGRLKGTLEVISYFGTDGAIAIIHSGSGFKENDRIELY
ncbi:hypothetical protein ACLVWU_09230 [Bdellovibrio sp. HCB290]|uniref:hypothetical protein n=1 Tax=Bdellovibrio sp. HCB290 TaxID=3394356 RepID=UPI0039B40AE1